MTVYWQIRILWWVRH